MGSAGIVVPVRGFLSGKSRLAEELKSSTRIALLRWMAGQVVAAAKPFPVIVVSSAPEVLDWADSLEIPVIADPGTLNAAAEAGVHWAKAGGLSRVVIVHADLPMASRLDHLARDAGAPLVFAVCSRDGDGTPALSVPTGAGFTFSYGSGSFARHALEAARLGLGFEQIYDPMLAHDVDAISDLADLPLNLRSHPAVHAALSVK